MEKPAVEKNDSGSFHENRPSSVISSTQNIDAKLANPLAGLSHEQLMQGAREFAKQYDLEDLSEELQKGALIAQDPLVFESLPMLDDADRNILKREITHRWDQPKTLYYLVILCSVAAAVQGMDESVINGAQLFYPQQLVNSAPYLCCAVLGCWLTDPEQSSFTALFSFLTCVWQGVTNSWPHLFAARFVLGLGIGPKSATVPVYAAECAPPPIRGALVMMWQAWTAFGIMFGFVADLAFYHVSDRPHITGLNWRLMLASAGIPALFIVAQVFLCPESPRWYIMKGRYRDAFNSLARLRHSRVQAARDLYYIHVLLDAENKITRNRSKLVELFTVPRNRRATLASFIVMFISDFVLGFGMVNWLFAFPAVYTIDTFGRRNLLLTTFPLMAAFLLLTGFAFWIPEDAGRARIGVVALGIYLFTACYSPGEGPVPFTYSAEAFPLYIRDVGMSFATAVLWFFNFVVSITFPRLVGAFQPQGAFGWYAGWNVFGFFAVLLFLPETKALSLEELDQVFSVPTHIHAAYQIKALPHNIKKYIFRMQVPDLPPLYEHEGNVGFDDMKRTYAPGGVGAA
ncbi:hypothetical protein BDZ89DRAFT_1095624 [Hymenopellis radicata]|nr:hypothetical protein BDZ89DRAFT_1095624 [Hymenopellis radicata]